MVASGGGMLSIRPELRDQIFMFAGYLTHVDETLFGGILFMLAVQNCQFPPKTSKKHLTRTRVTIYQT